MNDQNQNESSTEKSSMNLNDKEFRLMMAEDIWMMVKGVPIPDSYSEEDRLHIFERYYHRASAQRQGE
jgi:hypothetical protein